jgi:imidazolonepropionase-like amidohydrolase
MMRALSFVLLVALGVVAQDGPVAPVEPGCFALVGGRVFTMAGPSIERGVVLMRDGKIEQTGAVGELAVPAGYRVVDTTGQRVIPGFIELHNHTACSDLHDIVYQVNPELRVLDNIEMDSPEMRIARAGGVTTVLSIPGSGTNMGGFGAIVKTFGETPQEVLVRFPGALKIAQAGNPERGNGDLGAGRIGMNWMIRNVLVEGRAYHEAWCAYEEGKTKTQPTKDPRYEYLRGLYRGEYPVAVHTQIFQVVQSTLRMLARDLKLKVVIDHGEFDGFINARLAIENNVSAACGPRVFWLSQNDGRFFGLAASWYWLGVSDDHIGVNTDSPVVPQEELSFQAAMAIRHGLPEGVALKGLTINAARFLCLEKRLGSLETGKDADLAIWTGDPFDPRSRVLMTFVNGKVAYDAARDGQRF